MTTVDIILTAWGTQVGERWLWKLAKDFNVKVTIVKATIDADFG